MYCNESNDANEGRDDSADADSEAAENDGIVMRKN